MSPIGPMPSNRINSATGEGHPGILGFPAPTLVTGSAPDPSESGTNALSDFGCPIVAASRPSFSRTGEKVAAGSRCQLALNEKGAYFLPSLRDEHDSDPSILLIEHAEFIHAPQIGG